MCVCTQGRDCEKLRVFVCETGVFLFILLVTISLWDIKSIGSTFPSICMSLFLNFRLYCDCAGTMRLVFLVLHKIAAITVNVKSKQTLFTFLIHINDFAFPMKSFGSFELDNVTKCIFSLCFSKFKFVFQENQLMLTLKCGTW